MPVSDADRERMKRIMLHAVQVQDGLIPANSPDDFVKPEGDTALDKKGLPWWFGPDFHPTQVALDAAEREWQERHTGPSGGDLADPDDGQVAAQ